MGTPAMPKHERLKRLRSQLGDRFSGWFSRTHDVPNVTLKTTAEDHGAATGAVMTHILSRPDSIRQRAQHAATISGALAVALVVAAVTGLTDEVESFHGATKWLVAIAIIVFATSTVLWVYVVVFPHSRSHFEVVLNCAGDTPERVIEVICASTRLSRDCAEAVIEGVPTTAKKGLKPKEAENLEVKLKQAGATARTQTARRAEGDYQSLVEQYEIYADEVRQRMRLAATATAVGLLTAALAVVFEIWERTSGDLKSVTLVLVPQAMSDVDRLCPNEAPRFTGDARKSELDKDKDMVQVHLVQHCNPAITLPRRSIRAARDDRSDREMVILDDPALRAARKRCGLDAKNQSMSPEITANVSEDAPLATDNVELKDIGRRCPRVVRLPRKWITPSDVRRPMSPK